MTEKVDDIIQVELVTNSYEKNESEPIFTAFQYAGQIFF